MEPTITQNRLKSWTVWLATATLIAFVTKVYFSYEIPDWDKLVNLILLVLTEFGILNNPTVKNRF